MTEIEQMKMSLLDCERIDLYVDQKPLTEIQRQTLCDMQKRRDAGEPLQYILGQCDFYGLDFKVDPRVLIPRPETEIMVEAALDYLTTYDGEDELNVLDLGCGSGNIAITLAREYPHCRVTTVDISADALNVAQENARTHHVIDEIDFVQKDMIEFLKDKKNSQDKYHLIISNPPYIAQNNMQHLPKDVLQEPMLALEGGIDGLKFIKDIIALAPSNLKAQGCLFLEMADEQHASIDQLLKASGKYTDVEFIPDYTETNRIVKALSA